MRPALRLLVCVAAAWASAAAAASGPQQQVQPASSNTTDQAPVDEILKETFALLEALDERVGQAKRRSQLAEARDNARALADDLQVAGASNSGADSIEEALTRLAGNFSSDRQAEASASNGQASRKTGRQLHSGAGQDEHQQHQHQQQPVASDSTERHIKFTLDLMQAIFSSQNYGLGAKASQLESFLVSPLSIQTVLMMMHLGARGQTRREIADCLHLSAAGGEFGALPAPEQAIVVAQDSSSATNKLKRRHQQTTTSNHRIAARQLHSGAAGLHQSTTAPQAAAAARAPTAAAASPDPHKLFSGAVRNLLKDPIVMKALTNANQILLQKELPLAAHYERSIRHFYGVDVKPVDFQRQTGDGGGGGGGGAESPPASAPDSTATAAAAAASGSNNATATGPQPAANNIQLMVNEWVERQTRGRIANFLTAPVPTSTLMMALNVLYFRADWQYKFDPADTEPEGWFTRADGSSARLPMMVNRLPLAFAHDPHLKASMLELPYKAPRLGLFLLLPDEVAGIFHTMQMLNSSSFAHLIGSMRKPALSGELGAAANGINVRIPKFTIESSPHLSRVLAQQLGLASLFSHDSANLSGMFAAPTAPLPHITKRTTAAAGANSTAAPQPLPVTQQVGLDELLHKAVLEVDEQGSVAAASSASVIERVGLFNSNYFEADHPFLLFLMDKQTGLVLFSGVFAGNNSQ